MPSLQVIRRGAVFVAGMTFLCLLEHLELSRLIQFSGALGGGNRPTYTSPFRFWAFGSAATFVTPLRCVLFGLLVGAVLAIAVYGVVWWVRTMRARTAAAVDW